MTNKFSAILQTRCPELALPSGLGMNKVSTALLFLLISWGVVTAQSKQGSSAPQRAYSNTTLGFRYMPPGEMLDKTQRFQTEIRERVGALQTKSALHALLAMSSGTDDTVRNWHSVTIETYPRNAVEDQDDTRAEAKMSAWVAHSQEAYSVTRSVVISDQRFAVSVFGTRVEDGSKGAVVFTTVRSGKLLSFAFVANSPQQLAQLTESMKSITFF